MLFAGIDGGQSSTVAVVIDEHGTLLGRGTAGPSDHVDEPTGSSRAAHACEAALAHALERAGLPVESPLAAVTIGLSGYDGEWHGIEPRFHAETVRYVHDTPIALAAAIGNRPAALVLSGTGSVAYAETAGGRSFRIGGFGYLFGDDGSSFAIARSALRDAMRASDHGRMTDVADAALAFFDCTDLRALARAVSLKEISRPQLASFARVVFDAARLGDASARTVVDEAVAALIDLGVQIAGRAGASEDAPMPLALVGGTFDNADLRSAVERGLGSAAPHTRVVAPHAEPAVGAALLACDAAGIERPAAVQAPAPA